MKQTTAVVFAILTVLCGSVSAQDKAPEPKPEDKFFRLNLAVKESEEGKVINSRNYSTVVSTGRAFNNQSLRTGGKVPVSKGNSGDFTYIDVGVSFDFVFPTVAGNNLTLGLVADVSYVPAGSSEDTSHTPPLIRQNRWSAPVTLPLHTPTVVFSSDDVSSKRKLQVEVTATPITQ